MNTVIQSFTWTGRNILNKSIVLIDGDILAYRASAAIEKRKVEVTHKKTGKIKIFKTRAELKEFLTNKELPYLKEDYYFKDIQEAEEPVNAFSIIKNQVKNIIDTLWCDEYLICLSGKLNFRDSLPLPSKYKGKRFEMLRPLHLTASKLYLYKNYKSVAAINREADDDLSIYGYDYLEKGYTVYIATIDKDAYASSGLIIYDFTKDNPVPFEVPNFGEIHYCDESKKVKGSGFLWFCFQWILGDTTDNFNPAELAKVKFGEKSALKLLYKCRDEKEALEVCLSKYKQWYPAPFTYIAWDNSKQEADYKIIAQLYFKCCRMMESGNDSLDLSKFCNKYGVEL